jgi:hypothetical protein
MMQIKDILKSDKAWELKPDEVLRGNDMYEYARGELQALYPHEAHGQRVSDLCPVGFWIFKRPARAFRTGMVNWGNL